MSGKHPIRLVVTDLDGTLLNSKKEISPRFFRLMEYMRQQGIRLVAATGRQHDDIAFRFGQYADDLLCAGGNGTVLTDGGKVFLMRAAPKESILRVIETVRPLEDVYPLLCGVGSVYLEDHAPWFRHLVEIYCQTITPLPDISAGFDNYRIFKIAIANKDDGVMARTAEILRPFEKEFDILPSGDSWLDMVLRGASKGSAIDLIRERYGIPFEETAIFGDYLNDMSMMDRGYYSYAMKNAHPDIKAAARFVTEYTNEEDGVARTLERLLGVEGL